MLNRKTITKFFAAMILGLTLAGSFVGCNTMEGAGKDVEKTGDAIKDAARDAK